jgi:hypothetical protein
VNETLVSKDECWQGSHCREKDSGGLLPHVQDDC